VASGYPPSSSFVMVIFQEMPLAGLCALNPDSPAATPAASTAFVANSRFVAATLSVARRK